MQHQAVRRPLSKCLTAAAMLALALFAVAFTSEPAHAQTLTTLYSFPGGSEGYGPYDIVLAPDGTIYGGAGYGSDCACFLLFSLSNGSETVLHRFSVPYGYQPEYAQGLILGHNAQVLYGTSQYGGSYSGVCTPKIGCGFAFAYDLSSKQYKVLHEFAGPTEDGADPSGTQVMDGAGNLYGLTFAGGADFNGTLYEITNKGSEKLIYSFGNAPDATQPAGGLAAYGGNVYGDSIGGGANVCNNGGCGAIFEIGSTGEKVLYNFTGGADGQNPYELVGDGKGHFYGVSRSASNVVVAVFEIDASGKFSFAYNGYFAAYIQWVIPGPNGTLYGVATGGNSSCQPNGCGQIFQLTPTGNGNANIKVLHQFDGSDGSYPQAASLVFKNGALYGATATGGSANQGTIFKLVP